MGFTTAKALTNLLFVYGTLMRGERSASVMEGGSYLCAGRVEGFSLFDLGDFPGIYPTPEGRVFGELYLLEDIDSALSRLDAFEDVPRLFRREVIPVLSDRETLQAWAYVLQEDPRGHFPLIPGGDWRAYRLSRP